MQKRIVTSIALAVVLGAAATVGAVRYAGAQMYGHGMMGPGYAQGMGPNMMYGQGYGPGMMGPGMMHGPGYGPGMMGPGMMYGQGYGPGMMGPGMMGPGMMGPGMMGPGMMYGPGMMGPGYGMHGPGWFRGWANRNISVEDTKNYFERWVASQGNSRLKIGDVKEKDADTITVDIVTKDNSLVQRFRVNRRTGAIWAEEG